MFTKSCSSRFSVAHLITSLLSMSSEGAGCRQAYAQRPTAAPEHKQPKRGACSEKRAILQGIMNTILAALANDTEQ